MLLSATLALRTGKPTARPMGCWRCGAPSTPRQISALQGCALNVSNRCRSVIIVERCATFVAAVAHVPVQDATRSSRSVRSANSRWLPPAKACSANHAGRRVGSDAYCARAAWVGIMQSFIDLVGHATLVISALSVIPSRRVTNQPQTAGFVISPPCGVFGAFPKIRLLWVCVRDA